jgi:hypothetical protein
LATGCQLFFFFVHDGETKIERLSSDIFSV